jgi:chromosome partitioning protein
MIVIVGGLKGGTGKSTLATNLAALRALNGKEVLLIDADSQGSAAFWAEIRDEAGIKPRVPCVQKRGRRIHDEIREMAGKFDTIIIDAGGRDNPEQRSAILAADLMVIPTKASQYDLTSLDDLAAIIEDSLLINPHLKSVAVVNMAHVNPNVSEVEEARGYLADLDHISLTTSVIHDRIIFRKSTRAGQAVVEMNPPDPKATAEIQSLYAEIFSD